MFKKIFRAIFHYDWEVVEIQGAFFKMAWGVWIFLPWTTFGPTGYNGLANVMSETEWGILVMALGVIHFWAILSHKVWFRRLMIFVAFMFWIFMAVVFALSRIGNLSTPLMFVIAFFLAVNYLRLSMPQLFTFQSKP